MKQPSFFPPRSIRRKARRRRHERGFFYALGNEVAGNLALEFFNEFFNKCVGLGAHAFILRVARS